MLPLEGNWLEGLEPGRTLRPPCPREEPPTSLPRTETGITISLLGVSHPEGPAQRSQLPCPPGGQSQAGAGGPGAVSFPRVSWTNTANPIPKKGRWGAPLPQGGGWRAWWAPALPASPRAQGLGSVHVTPWSEGHITSGAPGVPPGLGTMDCESHFHLFGNVCSLGLVLISLPLLWPHRLI